MCSTCGDKGIVAANWNDHPFDFAVCLCAAGLWYRSDENAGKRTGVYGWQVWAYREQIDPSRIFMLEEVLTPQELAERGFQMPQAPTLVARGSALLAASRKAKVRL